MMSMLVLPLIMIVSSLNLTEGTLYCIVSSVEECIKIYGLDDSSVDYEILEIEDC